MSSALINPELVQKYNTPGPRYTSYPPAPHLSESIPEAAVIASIKSAAEKKQISLYIHLPFCQTLCWYCGCTTVITRDKRVASRYVTALIRELTVLSARYGNDAVVHQIHLGGGTPNFLEPEELQRLLQSIHSLFALSPALDASVELDPRTTSKEHLNVLSAHGFRRASLGVQDHAPEVQKAINRIQPLETTTRLFSWLKECGFESINVDLIYGLPKQTTESYRSTVSEVIALKPARLALFSYAHVPWLKVAQKALEPFLPSAQEKLGLFLAANELLANAGYVYIGMDHFALPSDSLVSAWRDGTLHRNFQGYSTHADSLLLGVGMSSISQSSGAFWQNVKTLDHYYSALDQEQTPYWRGYILTADDILRRRIIMAIMCQQSFNLESISDEFKINLSSHCSREIEDLAAFQDDGLVEKKDLQFSVTSRGRYFLRNIAMVFDATLRKPEARLEQRFSRTI